MAQNVTIAGASFSDVPSITVPKTGGGTASFVDTTIASSAAAASDIASGKLAYVNGSLVTGTASGGGGLTLLATQSLGSQSITSTSSTNLNKSVSVTGYDPYDALVVITSRDSSISTNGYHLATVRVIYLVASASLSTKTNTSLPNGAQNFKNVSSSTPGATASTSPYGIYPNSAPISNSTITIAMYGRYNNNNTGTINGNYTTRVYGVKYADLI